MSDTQTEAAPMTRLIPSLERHMEALTDLLDILRPLAPRVPSLVAVADAHEQIEAELSAVTPESVGRVLGVAPEQVGIDGDSGTAAVLGVSIPLDRLIALRDHVGAPVTVTAHDVSTFIEWG